MNDIKTKKFYLWILTFSALSLGFLISTNGLMGPTLFDARVFTRLPVWLRVFWPIYVGVQVIMIFFVACSPSKTTDKICRFVQRHYIIVYALRVMSIVFGILGGVLIGLPVFVETIKGPQLKGGWYSLYGFPNVFVVISLWMSFDLSTYINIFREYCPSLSCSELKKGKKCQKSLSAGF